MVVGLLIIALVVVVLVLVLVKTSEHALGKWLNADYAGVSTAGDYEYIVSSLGYAGYDSMITEKNWQEFMAYEYAVLMDVAEFIWEGQKEAGANDGYKDTVMGPYPAEYYAQNGGKDYDHTQITTETLKGASNKAGDTNGKEININESELGDDGKKVTGPAYMPYLPVVQKYNSAALTKEEWDELVIAGQGSARFSTQDPGEVGNDEFNKQSIIYGGNRDVMPPTLTYEFKNNPYEPDAVGSLVPYINVLKEQLQYFYFTVGNADQFPGDDPKSGGVKIDDSNIQYVDLMEISQKLNVGNPYITQSTVWAQYWENNSDSDPRYQTDAWVVADESYEQNLYFTNMYSSVMYKTALQVMIDRFLPKASLLTSWYYLKDTDFASSETQGKEPSSIAGTVNTSFKLEELLKDVKAIYNFYCWEQDEEMGSEDKDVVVYDSKDGTVKRDGDGKAQVETKNLPMATSNKDTFIHFGQAGIEANTFGVFFRYEPKGKHAAIPKPEAPGNITGDESEKTVPVITEILSEDAEFMDRFGFKVTFNYTYQYSYEIQVLVGYTEGGGEGVETARVTVSSGHIGHVWGSEGGSFGVCGSITCESCFNSYRSYSGYTVTSVRADTNPRSETYYLRKETGASEGGGGDAGGEPIYEWVTVTDTAQATGNIIIPYEATKDIAPRGDPSEGGHTMDQISQYIHDTVVLNAEAEMMKLENLKKASDFEIEYQEQEMINHGYWYPETTYKEGEDIHASPLTFFDERYHRNLGFYNFGAVSGDGAPSEDELKEIFKTEMNEQFAILSSLTTTPQDPFTGQSVSYSISTLSYEGFRNLLKQYLELYYGVNGGTPVKKIPVPEPAIPAPAGARNVNFDRVVSIDAIVSIGGIAENETDYEQSDKILVNGALESTGIPVEEYNMGPQYTKVSEQPEPFNAIYDIDDFVLALTMAVQQKRICTMIITDVEAWAKSATYNIFIMNNTFDYTNYRYVVPHSYFNFGVERFEIDEKPSYRTEYYKEYFSKVKNQEAGIKEADVLTMMLKWEEFADAGNETAYAYMRDLYKLIIFIREKYEGNQILDTAYSYLYVPDTIWEFREGISQEAFWTERLAAEMPGAPDALTDEELKKVKVRKDDIEWQVLNYDEYDECKSETNPDQIYVYALFPHGSSYVRSYFMQEALTGTFNDGGYLIDGHPSADWLARATIGHVMNDAFGIKEYEIRLRTARKILAANSTTGDLSAALSALDGSDTTSDYYKLAEEEVLAELKELKVKSPIVSIAAGKVTRDRYDCYSGFAVAVTHSTVEDTRTSYVHMRRWPNVQTNDIIGPGTIVGYEGTTGNSTGYHLHQNLWVKGKKSSPAEYMGPLFAPFYNKEKITEAIIKFETAGQDPMLALATDYMELYRTVLTYPFGQDIKDITNNTFSYAGNTYLEKSTVFESGDGEWYLKYADGMSNGVPMYQNTDGSVIVKVGNNQFYKCKIIEEDLSLESGDDENVQAIKCLKVQGQPEEVATFDETSMGTTQIKVTSAAMETAPIVWGNNVPLRPLFDDMEKVQDISILNIERMMDPADYSSEYAKDANDPDPSEDDVLAKDDFFDITSALVEDRMKIPEWILSFMSDMDSAFAVPFYEGPITIEMQAQVGTSTRDWGYAGTASGDVLALKKALKMKGYDPDSKLELSGDDAGKFTNNLKDILITVGNDLGNKLLLGGGVHFKDGEIGDLPEGLSDYMTDFGHEGACAWNAYVTYGSVSASTTVGREAARMGATVGGLRPAWVLGVAHCESGFCPTVDSFLFCSSRQEKNFYNDEPDDGFVTHRGVDKVLRRACGLMQIAMPGAVSMAASKLNCEVNNENIEAILRYLRNARTNAILGSEILLNMMNIIRRNENGYYDTLKANINSNSAFEEMEKASGIDKYEIGLIGAATLMYNMGPGNGNTERVIEAMKNVQFDKNKLEGELMPGVGTSYAEQVSRGNAVTCTHEYSGTGYWIGIMDYVVRDGYHTLKQLENK